jgi:hypothetical protein
MSEPLRELLHKAHELAEQVDAFTRHAIERDFTAMALDVSAITANTAEITRIAQAAQAGDSAAIQAAVAAQLESDQAAVTQAASDQAAALAPLTAEFPPPAAPAAPAEPTA